MKLKFKIDGESGEGYVALINPSTKEHLKGATVPQGHEIELVLPEVHSESGVEFGDVLDTEAAADTPQGGPQEPQETPSTSAASEKPLYHVAQGTDTPEGFTPSGLETTDGYTLYHYEGDTAGQSATFDVGLEGIDLYADADDNEQPVCPAAEQTSVS